MEKILYTLSCLKSNIISIDQDTINSDYKIKDFSNKLLQLLPEIQDLKEYIYEKKSIDNDSTTHFENVDSDADTEPLSDIEPTRKRENTDYDSDDEPLVKKKKFDVEYLLKDLFEDDIDSIKLLYNVMVLYRIYFNNEYSYIISPTNNIKEKIESLNKQYDSKGRIIVIGIYEINNFNYPSLEYKKYREFYNIDHNVVESLDLNHIIYKSKKYNINENNKEHWIDGENNILLDKNTMENEMWNTFYN